MAHAAEPNGVRWSWTFALYPSADGTTTRLISRNKVSIPSVLSRILMLAAVAPPAFIMTAAMLRGLRRRAERLALARSTERGAMAVR